jgi:hypothetical protein
VTQLSLLDACLARDAAIEHASIGAGPEWIGAAYTYLVGHATRNDQFLIEDVRIAAAADHFPSPPDARAWGVVARMAVKAGVIGQDGYGRARLGHMRPMPVWKSLVRA